MNEDRKHEGKSKLLKPNRNENHATTFSNNPEKDRLPLIGLRAETVNALRPTGAIRVKGDTYDAVAEGTFIDPLQSVRITGTRDFRLTVEQIAE